MLRTLSLIRVISEKVEVTFKMELARGPCWRLSNYATRNKEKYWRYAPCRRLSPQVIVRILNWILLCSCSWIMVYQSLNESKQSRRYSTNWICWRYLTNFNSVSKKILWMKSLGNSTQFCKQYFVTSSNLWWEFNKVWDSRLSIRTLLIMNKSAFPLL